MNQLTKEDIVKINKECPEDQGVFTEPWGIPCHIKEPVVYLRYNTGGMTGGGCWDYCHLQDYTNEEKLPKFIALDLVLKYIKPDISYLKFKEIENSIIEVDASDGGDYYGNADYYDVYYIEISKIEEIINSS